jgi:Xaa-Pro aminopeptidase
MAVFISCLYVGETAGLNLEVLARESLWSVGLNYVHGTGHGVGSFLCVHEYLAFVCIPPAMLTCVLEGHKRSADE